MRRILNLVLSFVFFSESNPENTIFSPLLPVLICRIILERNSKMYALNQGSKMIGQGSSGPSLSLHQKCSAIGSFLAQADSLSFWFGGYQKPQQMIQITNCT